MLWSFSDRILDGSTGYVYLWTNTVNGMMYIGSHVGTNPRYKSSGTSINTAFKEFGIENFTREILYIGFNYKSVENEILRAIRAGNKGNSFYNHVSNATGFDKGVDHRGEKNGFFGKTHTEENKAKQRIQGHERTGDKNGMFDRKHSEKSRKQMSDNTNHFGENNPMFGVIRPQEWRDAQSARMKGRKQPNRRKTKKTCPHCDLTGGSANMTRYHFDNCKLKHE